LAHRAHRSDVMRLQRLIDRGGIYLDLDTICVRSVSSLLGHRAVMGHQCPDGLCNAVILSVPGNPFLLEWLEEYRSFDGSWCNHSVFVPWTVSRRQRLSGCLTILPRTAFFDPSYDPDGISKMHDQDVKFPWAYSHHLWNQIAGSRLDALTTESVRFGTSTFCRIARAFL
jgi:hypothetical protein